MKSRTNNTRKYKYHTVTQIMQKRAKNSIKDITLIEFVGKRQTIEVYLKTLTDAY